MGPDGQMHGQECCRTFVVAAAQLPWLYSADGRRDRSPSSEVELPAPRGGMWRSAGLYTGSMLWVQRPFTSFCRQLVCWSVSPAAHLCQHRHGAPGSVAERERLPADGAQAAASPPCWPCPLGLGACGCGLGWGFCGRLAASPSWPWCCWSSATTTAVPMLLRKLADNTCHKSHRWFPRFYASKCRCCC